MNLHNLTRAPALRLRSCSAKPSARMVSSMASARRRSLSTTCWRRTTPRLNSNLIHNANGRRFIQLSSTPSFPASAQAANGQSEDIPDARFEVVGSSASLLSATLSPSQTLYTRRGTLLALDGKPENVVSTLSLLSPLLRAPLGIPFLHQRISSASPFTALIGTKSTKTSVVIVHLDGRLDWIIAQRNALLAWTGLGLSLKPKLNTAMSLAHWGNTLATGRGLLSFAGVGNIFEVKLKTGESYVVHPSNVVAYSVSPFPPQPYRFKYTKLRFQIPSLTSFLPDTKFFREIKKTPAWKTTANVLFNLRTWARRSIWGDRLFLRFTGPSTILIQSRGSRITDSLTRDDVNEIADSPAGLVFEKVRLSLQKEAAAAATGSSKETQVPVKNPEEKVTVRLATVGPGRKVKIN